MQDFLLHFMPVSDNDTSWTSKVSKQLEILCKRKRREEKIFLKNPVFE